MESTHSNIPRQFGKYRIIAHLATGGMAEIFLASQSSLAGFEKLVVVKRILSHLAQEEHFVQMFLDEAKIAAVLNHPNVVQIFDLGKINNQYFIAMEYLSGESLSLLVKTCRQKKLPFPPELAAGIIMQAAEGLHHAHTMTGHDGKPMNIVHRDVSPQNIFVLYDGGVKVVDFGIAHAAMRSSHTRTGTLKGKFSYMSPEQIQGEALDGRSDVFALGIVLWECLTARKLFRQENDLKLLQSITLEDAPSPRVIAPSVPLALEQITMKALARKREDRFQSASELRTALAGYLKSVAVEADTMAISRYMHGIFTDRIAEKRRLIEAAEKVDINLDETLFEDLSQPHSDTEHSIPRSTPDQASLLSGLQIPNRPHKRRVLQMALLVLLLGGGALGGYLLSLRGSHEDGVTTGTPAVDGGEQAEDAASKLSLDGLQAAGDEVTPDGGFAPDAGLALDAGLAVDAGSAKKPPKKQPPDKKNPIVAKDNPPQNKEPEVHAQPPGKLRLDTSPWTEIYFQGKRLGITPLVDVELPGGRIKLRAVNKEMGIDKEIIVEIKPGGRSSQRFNF
jgi:eukaryotic-like serine/threonine-protein kinase